MDLRMLPDVPLRLMSPDRDEIGAVSAVIVPASGIMNGNVELGFKDGDKEIAKLAWDRSTHARPTGLAQMHNICFDAHVRTPIF
jgi:hypothetical protein